MPEAKVDSVLLPAANAVQNGSFWVNSNFLSQTVRLHDVKLRMMLFVARVFDLINIVLRLEVTRKDLAHKTFRIEFIGLILQWLNRQLRFI